RPQSRPGESEPAHAGKAGALTGRGFRDGAHSWRRPKERGSDAPVRLANDARAATQPEGQNGVEATAQLLELVVSEETRQTHDEQTVEDQLTNGDGRLIGRAHV